MNQSSSINVAETYHPVKVTSVSSTLLSSAYSPIDIAWAAGILEGEGTFRLSRRVNVCVKAEMTDEDIILRLQCIFGGHISNVNRPSYKPSWVWSVTGDRAAVIMRLVLPHMGVRRSIDINNALRVRFDFDLERETNRQNRIILRDKLIAHQNDGWSLRRIGREYNMSHETVRQIIG
jgi:hypothetical protein